MAAFNHRDALAAEPQGCTGTIRSTRLPPFPSAYGPGWDLLDLLLRLPSL